MGNKVVIIGKLWRLMLPIALALLSGCGERASVPELPARADVKRGRQLAEQVGCGSCHRIPGIPSANGQVGPPLEGLAERAYIAGILPNHFDTLAAWIAEPQRFAPNSAMPNLGLSEDQARDIAAYLYSQGRRNIQTGEEF